MKPQLIPVMLFMAGQVSAQVLTPEMAVERAFGANPDLQAMRASQQIAARQNTAAFAGMTPQVTLTGGWNGNNQNTSLTFNNGSEVSRRGAGSHVFSGGLQVSQTIFDGMGMFAARKRGTATEQSATFATELMKRQVREQVLNSYWRIVKEQHWLKQLNILDSFYREKLIRVSLLFENGKSPYADVIQARADLTAQQVLRDERSAMLDNAMDDLNLLMGEEHGQRWQISMDSIPSTALMPDTSLDALVKANAHLRQLQADVAVAKYQAQEARAGLYPVLSAGANLNVLRSRSEVGVLLANRTLGSGLFLNLNYPIYSGGMVRQQIGIADLRVDFANMVYKRALLGAVTEMRKMVTQFQSLERQSLLQKQVTDDLREVMFITRQSYLLGKAGRVEMVQAQTSYEAALASFMDLQYRKMTALHALQRLLGTE